MGVYGDYLEAARRSGNSYNYINGTQNQEPVVSPVKEMANNAHANIPYQQTHNVAPINNKLYNYTAPKATVNTSSDAYKRGQSARSQYGSARSASGTYKPTTKSTGSVYPPSGANATNSQTIQSFNDALDFRTNEEKESSQQNATLNAKASQFFRENGYDPATISPERLIRFYNKAMSMGENATPEWLATYLDHSGASRYSQADPTGEAYKKTEEGWNNFWDTSDLEGKTLKLPTYNTADVSKLEVVLGHKPSEAEKMWYLGTGQWKDPDTDPMPEGFTTYENAYQQELEQLQNGNPDNSAHYSAQKDQETIGKRGNNYYDAMLDDVTAGREEREKAQAQREPDSATDSSMMKSEQLDIRRRNSEPKENANFTGQWRLDEKTPAPENEYEQAYQEYLRNNPVAPEQASAPRVPDSVTFAQQRGEAMANYLNRENDTTWNPGEGWLDMGQPEQTTISRVPDSAVFGEQRGKEISSYLNRGNDTSWNPGEGWLDMGQPDINEDKPNAGLVMGYTEGKNTGSETSAVAPEDNSTWEAGEGWLDAARSINGPKGHSKSSHSAKPTNGGYESGNSAFGEILNSYVQRGATPDEALASFLVDIAGYDRQQVAQMSPVELRSAYLNATGG